MHFLKQLFSRYTNPNRHRVKRLLKTLLLESLEQRIALDASGSPTLDALSDVTIDENAPEQTVNLTGITSGGTEVQKLRITAASDNTGLIPNPTVTPSPMSQPPDPTGVLSFTPVADQFGTAMITVTAENGGPDNNLETLGNNATLTQTFTVYVTQAGAPTLDPLSDLTIDENAPEQTVYLTGITSGGNPDAQQLKITAASDNTGLIPNPTVTPSSMPQPPDPTGVLSFTPEADQFGTAIITVTAENGGPDNNLATPGNNATLTQTFTVVVTEASNEPAPDAPNVRPQLERVREVHIDNSLAGPNPVVFGKSELVGYDTKSFVITHVAAGSTVEKWDAATNQWRDVSTPPTSSNPRQLLQLLQNRIIQKNDQVRWIPKSTAGVTQKAFEIIGWDDGSETSEPEGVNVPGAVENLEIDIVGDQVQVTWDPPTTGAAVTHYRIHQNPTTVVPSTQTSLTFAKVASPASYAVTVQANSAEGAGEAMTVTLSTGSYVKNDGTVVDPILDTSGNVLDYDGPKLKADTDLTGADLTGADLTGADLTGAFLKGADLTNTNLAGADLSGADLSDADLNNANLTGANLTNATLIALLNNATLIGANLTNANLGDADLTDAFLNGADLTDAFLAGANLAGANLTNANLTGADLTGATLTGANLFGVQSGGITGTPHALPTAGPYGNVQWQLIDGYLIGPGADLTGASLTDSNLNNTSLVGANLTNAQLNGAHLDNADLYNATLIGVQSGAITGTILFLPADWRLTTNGYLIGPSANLTNADLSNADLNNVDLSNATLTGVKSGGITGVPHALPTNWQLTDGYLIGPSADLRDADLNSADLSGADLTGADLFNVDLTGATLTGANLTGANLNFAILSGANLAGVSGAAIYNSETILPFVFDPVAAGWTLYS